MNVYDIFEDLGPGMAYLVTPLSLVLHCILLVVIGAVSFVYSCERPGLLSLSSAAAHQ